MYRNKQNSDSLFTKPNPNTKKLSKAANDGRDIFTISDYIDEHPENIDDDDDVPTSSRTIKNSSKATNHSFSDDEESELAFTVENMTEHHERPATTISQPDPLPAAYASPRAPPAAAKRSWTSASQATEKPGLWSRIKAKFGRGPSTTSNVQHFSTGQQKKAFRSESTTSMNSSKGIEPREFNQQSSLFRLQMVERMKERSSQLNEELYEDTMKKKEEQMLEEKIRHEKWERIRQEQAARGTLNADEHLRQRYSIMYYMNKEKQHDAMYVSSMIEMLMNKPEFRSSLSQFITQEAREKERGDAPTIES